MSFEATVRVMLNDYYQDSEQLPVNVHTAGTLFIEDMRALFNERILKEQEHSFLLNIYLAWLRIAIQLVNMPEERVKLMADNFTLYLKFNVLVTVESKKVEPESNVISIFESISNREK